MKLIDKVLRAWRTNIALKQIRKPCSKVFDIGCDEGYLLNLIGSSVTDRLGIDPNIDGDRIVNGARLYRGYFPADLNKVPIGGDYDAIFALAVFEHFTDSDLADSARVLPNLLAKTGRLIITVPHPWVDKILDVLLALGLIDGQATEQHHGFDPDEVTHYFGGALKLIKRERFQLGLNNVFVFEKVT